MKNLFSHIRMALVLVLGVFATLALRAEDTTAVYDYDHWIVGTTAKEVNYAVQTAQNTNRPLVVLYSNLSNCAHCGAVWNNALCDGGAHHKKKTCQISSSHPVVEYAKENKLVLLLVTTEVDSKYRSEHKEIVKSLTDRASISQYSYVALFNVPDTVDATNSSNTAIFDKEYGLNYIGKFRIVGSATASYNGAKYNFPDADSDVKESHFEKALELFFPNSYYSTIEPPAVDLSGYKNAVEITPSESEAMAECVLDSDNGSEQWFKFTAAKGKQYKFATDTPSASSKKYGYAFYTSAGLTSGTALKEGVQASTTLLTNGFALTATTSGTTYLRIYQNEMTADSSVCTLTYSVAESSSTGGDDDTPGGGGVDDDTPTGENDGEWEYSKWIVGTTVADCLSAFKVAQENCRPLVVLYTNLSNCAHCGAVWNNALCDGGTYHKKTCQISSSHPIIEYARKKKLVLLLVTTEVDSKYRSEHKEIVESLTDRASISQYSYIAIFNVPEAVTTSNTSNTAIFDKEYGLNYIGKFRIVGSATASYNGSKYNFPSDDSKVKESHFEKALELFFPNSYFSTIDPPIAAPDWSSAAEIAPFEHKENTTGKESLVTTDTEGKALTLALNGSTTEQWFKFEGKAQRRYNFLSYSNPTVSDDINITVEFMLGDGETEPVSLSPQRIKSSAGGSVISNGFYIDVDEDGIYYIKISRDGDNTVKDLTYNLSAFDIPMPGRGDIANPLVNSAKLGMWTTNLESALAAGKANNKAVLVCFEGVRWCPYCVYADYELFDTQEFKTWAKQNAYLVVLDNKLRDGYGPSIYNDNWEGGWLETNSITEAAGETVLSRNAELQKQYALSWRQSYSKPIGYPTLLAINPTTQKCAGRLEPYFASVDEVAELAALSLASSEEDNEEADNYISGASEVTAGESTAMIGGVDVVDWRKFEVNAGEEWRFTLKSTSTADIALALYDVTQVETLNYVDESGVNQENTGTQVGSVVTGVTADGVSISHVFEQAGDIRLCISTDADSALEYTLTAEKTSDINCEVSLPEEALVVNKYDGKVEIPVTIVDHNVSNSDAVKVAYTVTDDTATAGTDFIYDANATHEVTWTVYEKHAEAVKYITIDLKDNGDIWDGSRDFKVALTWNGGTGRIASASELVVKLTAKPDFADESEQTIEVVRGVPLETQTISVHASKDNTLEVVAIDGALPEGMTLTASENNQVLALSGTPSMDADDCSFTFGLQQTLGDKTLSSTEQKTLNFKIKEISDLNVYADPNYILVDHSFVGNLQYKDEGNNEYISGVFTFEVTTDGLTLKLNSINGDSEQTLSGWTSYDASGNFTAEFSIPQPNSVVKNTLTIVLDEDGELSGKFVGNMTVSGELRQTWSAEELAQFAEYYTAALKESDTGAHPDDFDAELELVSWGGMAFSLVSEQNDDGDFYAAIQFTAEMRDGASAVSGVAYLQKADEDDTGAASFCFCFPYKTDDASTAYVGGKLSIMKNEDSTGDSYTVSACDDDGAARYCGTEVSPLGVCGIDFDGDKPLYQHIGEGADQTNEFFFRVVTPYDLNDAKFTAIPRSIKVTEDEQGNFTVVDNPFELTITADRDEAGALTGFFRGSFVLYADTLGKQTVSFSGIYTPLQEACCSVEGQQPAGRGSYTLTDTDTTQQRYNVRLYPGTMTDKKNAALPESTLAIAGKTAYDDYLWSDADKLSADGDQTMRVLAIDAEGNVKFLTIDAKDNTPALSKGTWTLYFIGAADSDEYQMRKIGVITINDAADLPKLGYTLVRGWNLLALPWSSGKVLHADLVTLQAMRPYVYDTARKRLSRMTEQPTAGCAFWLYSDSDSALVLRVGAGDDANAPAFDDTARHLCAPHDALDTTNAMLWDSTKLRFTDGSPASATTGGWFKIKPAETDNGNTENGQ